LPDAGSCAQSTRLGFGSGMAPWGMQYVFEMGKTEIKCHTENEIQYLYLFKKIYVSHLNLSNYLEKLQWL